MKRSFLIAARRSAVAPRNGRFADLSLHALAEPVIAQTLSDAGLAKDQIGEIIVSNVLGEGGNPARVIALACGLPLSVAGLTLDRQCAGGLDALLIADAMIRSNQHKIIIAGGVESCSRQPLRLRTFADGSEPRPYTQAPFTPWNERDPDMAEAANRLAEMLEISQKTQDFWAIESHQKALATPPEIQSLPFVEIAGLAHDTFTRNLSPRHCAKAKTICGTITAANMAVAADAAAFVIVVAEEIVAKLNAPAVELIAGTTIGGDFEFPSLAPLAAIKAVLKTTKTDPQGLCVAEIMEAFAVQAIACQQGAKLPRKIVNPYGGALARGHPIGASGAILAVNLFHTLTKKPGIGLAAIAAAGGLGTALLGRA